MSKQDTNERFDSFGDVVLDSEVRSFTPKTTSKVSKLDKKKTEEAALLHGYERRIAGNKQEAPEPPPAESTKPIQFRVTEAEFLAFSEQAGKEFGFSKGAKSQLFTKIWREYEAKIKKHT